MNDVTSIYCSESNFCDLLLERSSVLRTGGIKGFVRIEKENNRVVMVYSMGRRDKGQALGFCPFCGFAFQRK